MTLHIAQNDAEMDEREIDASAANKGIMGWVRLHATNIEARVQIVVEHFRQNIAHLLDGKAKAMIVTASRKEAVRWTKAMAAYIKKQDYGIGLLVAFSGEVVDMETAGGPFSESNMNISSQGESVRDIPDAFKTHQYSILLVANKYQTGFDQPLLSAMYVDRKLGGVQAVQTLSRLNRAMPNKDTTYIVDFVNNPVDILTAFKQYHVTAELADVSNPYVVVDLRNKLDAMGYYYQGEVDKVAEAVVKPKPTQEALSAVIEPISHRLLMQFKQAQQKARSEPMGSKARVDADYEIAALIQFKHDLGVYIRVYEFMGQMFNYGNTAYEKLHLFARMLTPLLKYGRERTDIDLSALGLTHHKMRDLGQQRLNLSGKDAEPLTPIQATGSGAIQDHQTKLLAEIVRAINDLFEGEITEGDAVAYVATMKSKMMESPILRAQAAANSKEQFGNSPKLQDEMMKAVVTAMDAYQSMSQQTVNSEDVQTRMLAVLLGPGGLWKGLRA
jgi:type I restriction enzyme, R subunit